MSPSTLSRVSAIGVLAAVALMGLASTRVPSGYDWSRHYISMLFAVTSDGVPNPARGLAVAGILTFCASVAVLFHLLSSQAHTPGHRNTLQIGGIGSMVYAGLTVTPMHDLMVTISLAFFLAAMGALQHQLFVKRHKALLAFGALSFVLLITSAVMYYFNVLLPALPIAQKGALGLCVAWLFAVQFANLRPRP